MSGRVGAAAALAAARAAQGGLRRRSRRRRPPDRRAERRRRPRGTSPAPAARPSLEPAPAAPAAKASPRMGSAEKGEAKSWLGQCVACHNPRSRPGRHAGTGGEGRLARAAGSAGGRGEYPPGYQPKRPHQVMPPRPDLASSVPDLAAYASVTETPGGAQAPPGVMSTSRVPARG